MSEDSKDGDLVLSLKQGKQEALGILYDKYASLLLGLITKIVRDKDKSEEILRETFIEIWNQIREFDASKSMLFTWMFNIARKAALEVIKTEEIRDNFKNQSGYNFVNEISSNGSDIWDGEATAKESFSRLVQSEKDALNIIFLKGRRYPEAAQELNVPVETLKKSLRSAFKHLRRITTNE